MASKAATKMSFNNPNVIFATLFTACLAGVLVSGFQFEVGGEKGWKKPTGNEAETYNEWAAKNRFHIGDTVFFKYQSDSVLVVTPSNYLTCNTSNPISKFEDGSTVFQFDHPGFFYFISGQPGNCNSGQRIIIRVMHPSETEAPGMAPSPAAGGRSGGEGHASSAVESCAVSFLITAVVGFLVVCYLLM